MTANIVVLDCQNMFVEGIDSFFQHNAPKCRIVARVCTAEELHKTIHENEFDVLIMELNISDQDGMQIIEEVRALRPEIKICVLSSYTEIKFVKNAMVAGADGYVSKKSTFRELTYAISEIMNGNTYLGDGLRTSPLAGSKSRLKQKVATFYDDTFTLKNKLTKRETEILELITQGKSNKSIGGELYISDQTVGVHRKNIMKKLGIRNTASLIKFALENHLV